MQGEGRGTVPNPTQVLVFDAAKSLEQRAAAWGALSSDEAMAVLREDPDLAVEIARRILDVRFAPVLSAIVSAELVYRDLVYRIPPATMPDRRRLVPRSPFRPAAVAKLAGLDVIASPSFWADLRALRDEIALLKSPPARKAFARVADGKKWRKKHLAKTQQQAQVLARALLEGHPGRPEGSDAPADATDYTALVEAEVLCLKKAAGDRTGRRRGYIGEAIKRVAAKAHVSEAWLRKRLTAERREKRTAS